MKISKILLASLLGAVVINNVMADEYDGPRNRCNSKANKIWVEKNKICIPKNPCTVETELKNPEIRKVYCPDAGKAQQPQCDGNVQLHKVFDKYASKVLNKTFDKYDLVHYTGEDNERVYGVSTTDGGYIAVPCKGYVNPKGIDLLETAIWAYGFEYSNIFDYNPASGVAVDGVRNVLDNISNEECAEIADFAQTLSHSLVEYEYDETKNYPCVLMVSESEAGKYSVKK